MDLEEMWFGQVIALGGDRYQVVRKWDGATVRVAALTRGRPRKLLRYNSHGAIVLADKSGLLGLSYASPPACQASMGPLDREEDHPSPESDAKDTDEEKLSAG